MNSKGRNGSVVLVIVLVVVVVLAIAGGIWYYKARQSSPAQPSSSEGVVDAPTSSTAWTTYRNDDYGFSVSYPSDWTLSDKSLDQQCSRDPGVVITSPSRYDLPGYQGFPVQYIISISDNGSVADFGSSATGGPRQSFWNLDPSKYKKEQTAEYAIGQKIIASFVQGTAKPSSSTFQEFWDGKISFHFPCGWSEGNVSNQYGSPQALCSANACSFQGGILTKGTPAIEINEPLVPGAAPAGAVVLGTDSHGETYSAQLNDPSFGDVLTEIEQSFKIGTSSTP
jgi:hypothetical protein